MPMLVRTRRSLELRAATLSAIVCLASAGCDSGGDKAESKPAADMKDAAAELPKSEVDGSKPAARDEGAASEASDPNGPSLDGSLSFSINANPKSFAYIPSKSALVSSFSTHFQAKPKGGSVERLSISMVNFDPSKAELPTTLGYDVKKMVKSGDPKKIAKSPKPIVTYTDADGREFVNLATLQIESWKDGVLAGTIDDITLSAPNDTDHGSVELSGAKFSVKLR